MTRFSTAAVVCGLCLAAPSCRRAELKSSPPVVFGPGLAQPDGAGRPLLPSPTANPAIVWRKLGVWSGRGSVQTDPFISDTGALRIRWEAREESPPGRGRFRVEVHSDVSGRSLGVAVDSRGAGSDTAYFNEDPRPFFLAVESENVDWTLAVEEPLPTTAAPAASGR